MCDEWDSSAHEKVGYRIKNDQKTGRGISLLELIVVLSIVSIMAAIALPNMSRFVYDKALSQQTEQLATIIPGPTIWQWKKDITGDYPLILPANHGSVTAIKMAICCSTQENRAWG